MKKRFFATALVIILSLPLQCRAASICEQVLQDLGKRYGGLPGLSLEYRREVISGGSSTDGDKTIQDVAVGRLYFKPPHFIKLLQLQPREEHLITEGKNVWWHIPDKNKIERYPVSFFGRQLKLLSEILQGFPEGSESFHCDASPRESGTVLILKPDPPWKDVDHLMIEVSPLHAIRSINIRSHLGSTTRFVFDDMQVIETYDEDFFEFTPPEGVRIEDQGQH
jgi:outer membrane lipoprotein-sorting protein